MVIFLTQFQLRSYSLNPAEFRYTIAIFSFYGLKFRRD
jgi:hypothetical protein